ncbi:hypothetical protein HMPREF3088_04275, partial [Corynebacterium sp. HMSC22B11]
MRTTAPGRVVPPLGLPHPRQGARHRGPAGPAMDRPDPDVPASRLVTDYYGAYEDTFNLDVARPAAVHRVEPTTTDPASPLRITLADGTTFTADIVLNATGTWDNPYIRCCCKLQAESR